MCLFLHIIIPYHHISLQSIHPQAPVSWKADTIVLLSCSSHRKFISRCIIICAISFLINEYTSVILKETVFYCEISPCGCVCGGYCVFVVGIVCLWWVLCVCACVGINTLDFIKLLTGCDYMFLHLLLSVTVAALVSSGKDDAKIKNVCKQFPCYLSPPLLLPSSLHPPPPLPSTPS